MYVKIESMGTYEPRDTGVDVPPARPPLGASRSRVLNVLHDSPRPMTVDDVVEQVHLHPNTVRFHLDALVDARIVDRTTQQRTQPGRPRALYAVRPGTERAGARSYRLLAEILTGLVASQTARPAWIAMQAGRSWGRHLASRPSSSRGVDIDGAIAQLISALDRTGFEPELAGSSRDRQVLLHECPFREIAEAHRDVACSIHLGLMQGVLDEIDAPVTAERLDPFVEPSLCVTYLGVTDSRKRAS
jgi:predicted ArsR family transcriptional regulator